MQRRSRIAIRPNVRSSGRDLTTSQQSQTGASSQESAHEDLPKATNHTCVPPADGQQHHTTSSLELKGQGGPVSPSLQRRKRFPNLPNLTKLQTSQRVTKSPPGHATETQPVPTCPTFPKTQQVSSGCKHKPVVAQSRRPKVSLPSSEAAHKARRPSEGNSGHGMALPTVTAPPSVRISADRERMLKVHKLKELMKQTRKKAWKSKLFSENNMVHDHNRMTMGDLIYYLPETNPMRSSVVEEQKQMEKEVQTPPEEPPDSPMEAESEKDDDVEEQRDQLVVPRVKVAEDGSLILDEESLTVQVSRVRGPNTVEENDPIFERGSSTTYSSFRKNSYTKPWSNKETDMFYLAISMVGTDFSMIGQLFPHRARAEIKNKFKKEERANAWRIDKAFREKHNFDMDFFSSLLEKALAEEKKTRQNTKNRCTAYKASAAKPNKAPKERKKVSRKKPHKDVSEDQTVPVVDSDMAEKENEDSNVVEPLVSSSASQRSSAQIEGEPEAACPAVLDGVQEDGAVVCENSRGTSAKGQRFSVNVHRKGPVVKPAQLTRRHLHKPVPNLERLGPKEVENSRDDENAEMEQTEEQTYGHTVENTGVEGASEKRIQKGKKPLVLSSDDEDEDGTEDEEPDLTVMQEQMLNKPTRSGRIPKLSLHLQQAGEDSSDGSPPSPLPKHKTTQRSRAPGRNRMFTLRASSAPDSGEEEAHDVPPEETYGYPVRPEEQNQVPAFVPLSLRSPEPVHLAVEETMEELEISVNEPHAIESECRVAQEEASVSATHPMGLLVDVMEYVDPGHVAEPEDSYNEAARTLLTIRNPELLTVTAPSYSTEVIISEVEQLHDCEVQEKEEETPEMESSVTLHLPVTELDMVATSAVEPQNQEVKEAGVVEGTVETGSQDVSVTQLKRSRFPKPKPNLARVARVCRVPPAHGKPDSVAAPQPDSVKSFGLEEIVLEESKAESSDGNPPEEVRLSAPPAQTLSINKRSRFPKPKPNLGGPARVSRVPTVPAGIPDMSGQQECIAVRVDEYGTERTTHTPATMDKTEEENEMPAVVCGLTGEQGQTISQKDCSDEQVEVGNSCNEGHHTTALGRSNAEGAPVTPVVPHHEPTFILTLFEIPSSSTNSFQTSPVQEGAVTAELLSPLVFIETGADESGVEADAVVEGNEFSHFLISNSLCAIPEGQTEVSEYNSGKRAHQNDEESVGLTLAHAGASSELSDHQSMSKDDHKAPLHKKRRTCHTEESLSTEVMSTQDVKGTVRHESAAITPLNQTAQKQADVCHSTEGNIFRGGRKPKGFLSFISNKGNSGCSRAPRPARPAQRVHVNTSRLERKRPVLASSPVPNTTHSGSTSKCAESPLPQSLNTTPADGEEPTNVSEYFFCDIFTEVEEAD